MAQSTKSAFDTLSEASEEQLSLWKTNPYDQSLYRAEVAFVQRNAPPRGLVVELGCGWDPYVELVDDRRTLLAVDFSIESLKKVTCTSPNLHLVCADVNWLPIDDDVADFVIATDELICCDTVEPERMLSEAYRVLRPGGLFVLEYDTKWCLDTLWMLLDSWIGNSIGYEVSKGEMYKLFGSPGGGMVTWGLPGSDEVLDVRFFTHREVRALLRDAGFTPITQRAVLVLGGLIPTVIQQRTQHKLTLIAARLLARVDAVIGSLPLLRSLGGDTLLLAQKA